MDSENPAQRLQDSGFFLFRWFGNILDWLSGNNGRNVIAGGLALTALVLPIVIITTIEALRAVPRAIREGALGVGATQWETIRHHVLPAASPGILTGTVLSLARAAGEAAPILIVGAVTGTLITRQSRPGRADVGPVHRAAGSDLLLRPAPR